MKTKLMILMLLVGTAAAFAGPHFFVGVGVGGYYPGYYAVAPPPPPVITYAVPSPGPGYAWVGGYYYPYGAHWGWHGGYWARRPYAGAYWVGPRYYGHRYYRGYWRR